MNGSPPPPILKFEQIPLDWGDLRFLVRATATAMRSHDALDEADFRRVETLARDAERLRGCRESLVRRRPARRGTDAAEVAGPGHVLLQAMRPFLTRAAEAIMARTIFAGWRAGTCPLCAGEPDFAVITPAAERILICGRCSARWRFHQLTCPFCLNADREPDHVVREPRRPVSPVCAATCASGT